MLAGTMILCASSSAFADDACSKDVEEGKRARSEAKLTEARAHFLACSSADCSNETHRDCMQWASEVLAMTPTIVIEAKDASGTDIADVVVTLDDKVIADRVEGSAIAIDPGSHMLRFEHKGFARISKSVSVKEGEKARVVSIVFVDRDGPPLPPRGLVSSGPTGTGGHTAFPWIVAGAGAISVAVGAIVLATTPSLPAGCAKSTQACTELASDTMKDNPNTPDVENEQLLKRQRDAGRSEDQPVVGAVMMGLGGLFLVGGLLWHFLETPDAPVTSAQTRRRHPHVSPFGGPTSAAILATF